MPVGRVGAMLAMAVAGFGCAHTGSARAEKPMVGAGKYAVESIRSRAQLDGVDRLIEISESGTKMTDATGADHVLTERGALLLEASGACRLALAVSVDGEEPGVSDRECTWKLDGDRFFLGDATGSGARTVYEVTRVGGRIVLEGMSDLDAKGNVVGDAKGERIVLVEHQVEYAGRSVDRTSEQAVREIQEYLHDL